jgi:DNA invertase Pin-like site-specific DNA recombinase
LDTPAPRIRAVMYARMSTEHQQYSTENQSDVMRDYAARHSMEIVRAYTDDGKSGLRMDGRDSLQRLLDDVQRPARDFEAILVYDVSRWGRFQDADESAFHEYVCRRAGVAVHYCAEQFANDGSTASAIIKAMKRAMAGEYSRELSAKVFQGQCRLIQLGYRQGGMAGYGLRRVLVDQHGTVKGELAMGEHKSIQTDRVVLHPGPPEEVAAVQWMYRQFVSHGDTERDLAAGLNARGILTDLGRPWTRGSVHQVLTNEKYVGNNVYNRVSFKLKQKRVRNHPDQYVRAAGVFDPVVDPQLFARAQAIIAARFRRFSDEELLAWLKQLYAQHGRLSAVIIDEYEEGPSSGVYQGRFGSLVRAYRLVGYVPDHDYAYLEINRHLRRLHPQVVVQIVSAIEAVGASIVRDARTDLLTVNEEFAVSVVVSRCLALPSGACRWVIRLDSPLHPDITVAVRMDQANHVPLDYYLLPTAVLSRERLRLAESNGLFLDAYRFETLDYLIALARRTYVKEVV